MKDDIMIAAAEAFNNTYHKVRAEVSMDDWQAIWRKAVGWADERGLYRARYEVLREVYREDHPRITNDAIDAFVDGRIAGAGVAAGREPVEPHVLSVQAKAGD